MPHRPALGQPAPRFELPALPATDVRVAGDRWSLSEHLGNGQAVVLIFHRHIH